MTFGGTHATRDAGQARAGQGRAGQGRAGQCGGDVGGQRLRKVCPKVRRASQSIESVSWQIERCLADALPSV